jgi:hypothetical protein
MAKCAFALRTSPRALATSRCEDKQIRCDSEADGVEADAVCRVCLSVRLENGLTHVLGLPRVAGLRMLQGQLLRALDMRHDPLRTLM